MVLPIFADFSRLILSECELLGAPLLIGKALDSALAARCSDLSRASDRLRSLSAHDALLILTRSLSAPKLNSGKTVILISLDFSKAFDMVRHQTLFEKLDKMDIDDRIFNWMISYFENRTHSTKFPGSVSDEETINASVVQGSSLGPASYSVAESDLKAKKRLC